MENSSELTKDIKQIDKKSTKDETLNRRASQSDGNKEIAREDLTDEIQAAEDTTGLDEDAAVKVLGDEGASQEEKDEADSLLAAIDTSKTGLNSSASSDGRADE